jgi:hypothetical protein
MPSTADRSTAFRVVLTRPPCGPVQEKKSSPTAHGGWRPIGRELRCRARGRRVRRRSRSCEAAGRCSTTAESDVAEVPVIDEAVRLRSIERGSDEYAVQNRFLPETVLRLVILGRHVRGLVTVVGGARVIKLTLPSPDYRFVLPRVRCREEGDVDRRAALGGSASRCRSGHESAAGETFPPR